MITQKGHKLFEVMFTQEVGKFVMVSVVALDEYEARRLAEEMLIAENYEKLPWAGTSPGRLAICPIVRKGISRRSLRSHDRGLPSAPSPSRQSLSPD
jgi:hypothetical protein